MEINDELKALAENNPTLVRAFTLPQKSVEGRDIMGIEIAEGVGATGDGRPAFVMVGTHHAREWPANEATIEWGYELVNGYKSGDGRLTNIVKNARNFVVPVQNVDGFDVTIKSEGLTPGGNYADPLNSGGPSGDQGTGTGAYKRKNCRKDSRDPNPAPEIPCLARSYPPGPNTNDRGVDTNRNYGILWGGPGTSSDFNDLTYSGTGPFSEPEVQAFRDFVRSMHPAVLITNHTYTGLLLRPPGTADQAPVPDADQLKALGDRMGYETDYISQFSYQLYDTTGTTDDYLYGGLSAFSYTPEIGKEEFHPDYIDGPDAGTGDFVKEYDGNVVDGVKRGGLREAFKVAAEAAINPASHSVLRGTAPGGRVLRLQRTITYRTDPRPDDDPEDGLPPASQKGQSITEDRQTVLAVPANGSFEWHINPSTQPNQDETPWRLTCEDGAGNVLEARDVFVARSQTVTLGLACGAGASATNPTVTTPTAGSCTPPNGFRSVNVRRSGRGLRILFSRRVNKPVAIDVFQTSKGRRIIADKRVARFRNRFRSLTWSGRNRSGRRVADGVYYVRFRIRDAENRLDSRRLVVERKRGRFAKRGRFYIVDNCR